MIEPPTIPRATYRLQFRNGFGLEDGAAIVPYMAELGVSHVYASPIFKAREGSTHGYDAVDFNQIDPVIGGEAGFEALISALESHGMGLVLDFVPNHMGVGSDNGWWWDVLAKGEKSAFADYFDIDWQAGGGKVTLPFLASPLDDVLAAGDLALGVDPKTGMPALRYHDQRWPITDGTIDGLAAISDASLDEALLRINSDKAALASVIERQAYRPIHWRDGPALLNYRRFFNIDDLTALRMERDEVFEASHRLLLRLIGENKVQGVRLDHIDGLLDPVGYCRRLANAAAQALGAPPPTLEDIRAGRPIYLVVEKILGHGEQLPSDLMAAGTTGYEFMTALAQLMVDPAAETALADAKAAFGGERRPFETIVKEAKVEVLTSSFKGELDQLSARLCDLAGRSPRTEACSPDQCRDALIALITAFPVYRPYVSADGASSEDRRWIKQALNEASLSPPASDLLGALLLGASPTGSDILPDEALAFAMTLQQLTGPVMAKAVEDRAFYRDLRLVSLNDVGGEPGVFGGSVDSFHAWVEQHQAGQPSGLLATATHDHKRGEDVRARLHRLSDLPDDWRRSALGWQALNAHLIEPVAAGPAPSPDDEYLIYQTLLGAWPIDLDPADQPGLDALKERLIAYMQKASREAGLRTSWTEVDAAYEEATARFIDEILKARSSAAFLEDLVAFGDKIAIPGMIGGLVQTALKLTLPGVPDLYQGTETWDFSLVDPDNRRPVDFDRLARALDRQPDWATLLADWKTGQIKQALIRSLLALRSRDPALFEQGVYRPIEIRGAPLDHLLAFARMHEKRVLIVALPTRTADAASADLPVIPMTEAWKDGRLCLPAALSGLRFRNALAEKSVSTRGEPEIALADVAETWPIAVLIGDR